ncbi:radical SAM protein [Candidatus Pacearchaeota archaeon]|nr:radical SAM protein [Candidatus Pacearchaeota archaeon]
MEDKKDTLHKIIKEMKLPYLRFSVTKDCNGNCAFCHNEGQGIGVRGTRSKICNSDLDLSKIKDIAIYFKKYFKIVKFTGGEPLLLNNFTEIVKVFHNAGYLCTLTTNGFLLDEQKQIELKNAGIKKINISIPSLNKKEYDKLFRVKGYLDIVLKNLKTISKHFKKVKINFMANKNNLQDELLKFDKLSKDCKIDISVMELITPGSLSEPISSEIISILEKKKKIKHIKSIKNSFGTKKVYTFCNGGTWEIDDFRESNYRKKAFDNKICSKCHMKDICTEGPYAMRLSSSGTLRPCLIRQDNLIEIGELNIYKKEVN